jgi:hydrogenase-4 membrane subunit HyfE
LLVSLTRGDVAYVLVIVWAFVGIAVKHADTTLVAWTAWGAAAFVAITLLIGILLQRRRMRNWAAQRAPIRDRW